MVVIEGDERIVMESKSISEKRMCMRAKGEIGFQFGYERG